MWLCRGREIRYEAWKIAWGRLDMVGVSRHEERKRAGWMEA